MSWSKDLADWTGKKVLVLGLGKSGVSAAEYLAARGAQVLLSESRAGDDNTREQVSRLKSANVEVELGGHSENALNFADLVVVSPGISPDTDIIKQLTAKGKEIICDVELASRETTVPVIGITGTNGKSTTCALVSHILQTAGHKAPACGNFGMPILDELAAGPDFLVVEVSSYQLHYCTTLSPAVAVWMNLTPDHIEWHGNLERYTQAKQKLFANQKSNQFAILNEDDPIVREFLPESEIFSFSAQGELESAIQGAYMKDGFLVMRINGRTRILCHEDELKIIGKHNLENALAATGVAAVLGVDADRIIEGLRSFPGLEHRLEYVATIDGIKFYNDSKATNPNSTIKALESFGKEKIVLIAGGKDKLTPLSEMVASIKMHASDVILLGEAKDRFARSLSEAGYSSVHSASSLEEAVNVAASLGRGPVVLSPACASFDMFKNFEERGHVFKTLVRAKLESIAAR